MIKHLKKKILLFLGVPFSFVPTQMDRLSSFLKETKPTVISTKLENKLETNKVKQTKTEDHLKESKHNLNQSKIYLLVTSPTNNKGSKKEKNAIPKNILLLLETQDRLSSEEKFAYWRTRGAFVRYGREGGGIPVSVGDERSEATLAERAQRDKSLSSTTLRRLSDEEIENRRILKETLFFIPKERTLHFRPRKFPFMDSNTLMGKKFHNTKNYYSQNKGGYKAICPVFFSKEMAEDFLLHNFKNSLSWDENSDFNKFVLQEVGSAISKIREKEKTPIKNTKIIEIGLGDFLGYYSLPPNNAVLEKVDFLFLPSLEQVKRKSFFSRIETSKTTTIKGFKDYQKEFLEK